MARRSKGKIVTGYSKKGRIHGPFRDAAHKNPFKGSKKRGRKR